MAQFCSGYHQLPPTLRSLQLARMEELPQHAWRDGGERLPEQLPPAEPCYWLPQAVTFLSGLQSLTISNPEHEHCSGQLDLKGLGTLKGLTGLVLEKCPLRCVPEANLCRLPSLARLSLAGSSGLERPSRSTQAGWAVGRPSQLRQLSLAGCGLSSWPKQLPEGLQVRGQVGSAAAAELQACSGRRACRVQAAVHPP